MNGLVIFVGVVAFASGVGKVAGRGRLRNGIPLLALLELLAGMLLPALAFTRPLAPLLGGALVASALALVVISTGTQMRTARRRRLRRQATEEARLKAHVDFLSRRDAGEGPEREG